MFPRLRLLSCMQTLLSLLRGDGSSTGSNYTLSIAQSKTRLFAFWSSVQACAWTSVSPSDVYVGLRLCFWCYCWISAASEVSSWTFVLSRFLVQHCPCLVPYAVQERHGVISLRAAANFCRDPAGSWDRFFGCDGSLQSDTCPTNSPPLPRCSMLHGDIGSPNSSYPLFS